MNGVFRWTDAVAYFGPEIDAHAQALSRAGQTTYGLLACRSAPDSDTMMTSREGVHAERRLVLTSLWQEQIDAAIGAWDMRDTPMVILLALNRSPCADCAQVLAGALHALERKYALRCGRQHFILASLGYYQGRGFMDTESAPNLMGQPSRNVSTDRGLRALRDAGWRLCVLDFGQGLTRRGEELLEYLNYAG